MSGAAYDIDVIPDASGWSAKLEAQIGAPMRALAEEFKRRFSDAAKNAFDGIGARLEANLDPATRRAADNLRDQLQRGIREGLKGTPGNSNRQGQQSGRQYADAFSREVKAKLEAAFRSLPDAPLSLNSTAADVEIAEIRAKLEAAAKDIDLGVNTDVVDARVAALQARLKVLAENSPDVRVQVNTTAALAQVEAFRAALKRESKKAGDDAGKETADAFTRQMRTRLTAAFQSLPKLKIDANSSAVDRTIAEIRRKLEAADRAVKLGVDTKLVDAKIEELRLKLIRLSHSADIKVRVNAGAALAELEAIRRLGDDNKRGNIFTRLVASAREASPVFDTVISKLGAVGGAASSIGGNNLAGTLALVAAIVAALSAVGPLAAAATGALIGIGGAAGVATLAVVGLKRQMAQQTGFGQGISDQFKSIRDVITGLGEVAANSVGPAIRDVLGLVRSALPGFEGLVKLVGGRLGGALREVGIALVTAFQKASPLIVEVAGYIEDGAAGLARWVASPSFDAFIAYARKELPVLIGQIKDIGGALIATFVALAPLGEKVLKVITFIVQTTAETIKLISSAIQLGGGSLLGKLFGGDDGKAKKAADDTDNLLASYQKFFAGTAATTTATSPLDSYAKIIGDLGPRLELAAGNAGQLQVAVSGITDRLRSANPALQAFMDTATAYDPATAKLADTAKLLSDALTASRGFALDYTASLAAADTATLSFAKSVHDNLSSVAKDGTLLGISHLDAAGKFVAAAGKYTQGSSEIVAGFQQQVQAATDAAANTYTQVKASTGDSQKAAADALTVYKGLRDQIIAQGKDAGLTAQQVQTLSDTYFAVPKDVQTFVDLLGQDKVGLAIQDLTAALNRLSDFIGVPKVQLNTTDYDNSLAIANSNLNVFGQQKRSAVLDANSGLLNAKMGQANNQLDRFDNRTVGATVSIDDFASAKLLGVGRMLDSLNGRVSTVYVNTVTGGRADTGTQPRSAYGNIFSSVGHYAAGGIIDGLTAKMQARAAKFARGSEFHIPQIAMPNGGVRVWAEPETQGEAYIPLAMDRRFRAENILADVAQRFGFALLPNRAMQALQAVSSAAPARSLASDLVGLNVNIDGTLVGVVTSVADGRIEAAAQAAAHGRGAGDSSVVR